MKKKRLSKEQQELLVLKKELLGLLSLKRPTQSLPDRAGVYLIVDLTNYRFYVGESNQLNRRMIQHFTVSNPTQFIDRIIRQKGIDSFATAVLAYEDDYHKRRALEREFVELLNSHYDGYNGSKDGGSLSPGYRCVRKLFKEAFPNYTKKRQKAQRARTKKQLKRAIKELKRRGVIRFG